MTIAELLCYVHTVNCLSRKQLTIADLLPELNNPETTLQQIPDLIREHSKQYLHTSRPVRKLYKLALQNSSSHHKLSLRLDYRDLQEEAQRLGQHQSPKWLYDFSNQERDPIQNA